MLIFELALIVKQGVKTVGVCTINFVESFDRKAKKKFDFILYFTVTVVILIVIVAINKLVVIIVLTNIPMATINCPNIIITSLKLADSDSVLCSLKKFIFHFFFLVVTLFLQRFILAIDTRHMQPIIKVNKPLIKAIRLYSIPLEETHFIRWLGYSEKKDNLLLQQLQGHHLQVQVLIISCN